jgi:hypothetical protein
VKVGYDAISDGEHERGSHSVDTKEKRMDGWGNMTESRVDGKTRSRPEVVRGDSQGTSSSFMTAPA